MLGALLGGLAGILFPTAGAAATGAAATGIGALLGRAALPALGAGLGTLVSGGDSKDAIRNALLFGAGSAVFPGAVQGIRESGFGKGLTGGLGQLFGIGGPDAGGQGAAAPAPAPAPALSAKGEQPQDRPSGLPQMAGPSFESVGRQPAPSSLPSLSEMASMDRSMSEDRAARDFDLALDMPVGMSLDEAMMGIDSDLIGYGPGRVDPRLYEASRRREGFAEGGAIEGPGTGTSDSVPAEIYQDGKPVRKAKLSDGEFVMTAAAVKGAGKGSRERGISRMYELMRRFESGEMA